MASKEQKWADLTVTKSCQMWAPAARLVAVHAWADAGREGHDFYPVVAVQTTVERCYTRSYFTAAPEPPGEGEQRLLDDGWHYYPDNGGVRHRELIVIDGGLCTVEDARRHYLSGSVEVVACPWPEAEDAERLAPVVTRLQESLRRRERKAVAT